MTSRRTTVIAVMGESSAVAGPAGRYLLRSMVRTLPMAKSVAMELSTVELDVLCLDHEHGQVLTTAGTQVRITAGSAKG